MKEILTKLFGEAVTDDALKQFNAELGKKFVAKADYNAKADKVKSLETELGTLNTEFDALKTANASGEDWKAKYEALQAENLAKEKQAEADRILREKTENTNNRFNTALGDKKFSHEAIREAYLKKFGEALENPEYQGKSDTDIIHALTKDDASAFVGVTAVKLAGGRPQSIIGGSKYTSREEIIKIKDAKTRQSEMLAHPHLFPEIKV